MFEFLVGAFIVSLIVGCVIATVYVATLYWSSLRDTIKGVLRDTDTDRARKAIAKAIQGKITDIKKDGSYEVIDIELFDNYSESLGKVEIKCDKHYGIDKGDKISL
jgi:hypothetical protein